MDGIHPKFVLSKRFPVHAAIEQLDLAALKSLLTPASDARFHFGRKLTNTEVKTAFEKENYHTFRCQFSTKPVRLGLPQIRPS